MCSHERFDASVVVNHLEDIDRYALEVRCKCADCGQQLEFQGHPVGLDLGGAVTVDPSKTELRVTAVLKGKVAPPIEGVRGFEIFKRN